MAETAFGKPLGPPKTDLAMLSVTPNSLPQVLQFLRVSGSSPLLPPTLGEGKHRKSEGRGRTGSEKRFAREGKGRGKAKGHECIGKVKGRQSSRP